MSASEQPAGAGAAAGADPADEEGFRALCTAWLAERWPLRPAEESVTWGEGSDSVAVFHRLTTEEERALLDRALAWQAEKFAAGFGALAVPARFGGMDLPRAFERIFREEEARFAVPAGHEAMRITVNMLAPTILAVGTEVQQDRFVRSFLGGRELCCQLFSEPGAGSDLAGVATRAERDGDSWVVNGSKVWASGARFAQWGELLARTDPDAPKHAGMTAFMLDMSTPGVEVRPIRQMSGGASFNEVFFTDVRIPDDMRLGEPGSGWKVALTTLGFERGQSGSKVGVGASWPQLRALATWSGGTADPKVRQDLMRVYSHETLRRLTRQRAEAASRAGGAPGPEGSLGKLLWVQGLLEISDVAARLLGPRLAADSGEWGTFAWNEHIQGSLGYRLAGGSDEIQRNIIAERVLGLPPEPREDRSTPWRDLVGRSKAARS
ncbi:MAG: acyl-CoA dehydrogenase family protein [Acidimicrobiia bacterium]